MTIPLNFNIFSMLCGKADSAGTDVAFTGDETARPYEPFLAVLYNTVRDDAAVNPESHGEESPGPEQSFFSFGLPEPVWDRGSEEHAGSSSRVSFGGGDSSMETSASPSSDSMCEGSAGDALRSDTVLLPDTVKGTHRQGGMDAPAGFFRDREFPADNVSGEMLFSQPSLTGRQEIPAAGGFPFGGRMSEPDGDVAFHRKGHVVMGKLGTAITESNAPAGRPDGMPAGRSAGERTVLVASAEAAFLQRSSQSPLTTVPADPATRGEAPRIHAGIKTVTHDMQTKHAGNAPVIRSSMISGRTPGYDAVSPVNGSMKENIHTGMRVAGAFVEAIPLRTHGSDAIFPMNGGVKENIHALSRAAGNGSETGTALSKGELRSFPQMTAAVTTGSIQGHQGARECGASRFHAASIAPSHEMQARVSSDIPVGGSAEALPKKTGGSEARSHMYADMKESIHAGMRVARASAEAAPYTLKAALPGSVRGTAGVLVAESETAIVPASVGRRSQNTAKASSAEVKTQGGFARTGMGSAEAAPERGRGTMNPAGRIEGVPSMPTMSAGAVNPVAIRETVITAGRETSEPSHSALDRGSVGAIPGGGREEASRDTLQWQGDGSGRQGREMTPAEKQESRFFELSGKSGETMALRGSEKKSTGDLFRSGRNEKVHSSAHSTGQADRLIAGTAAGESNRFTSETRLSLEPRALANQLLSLVSSQDKSGVQRVRVVLQPPHLGSLDMEVIVRDKMVRVLFRVDSGDIGRFLQAGTEQLKGSLQGQGFTVDNFTVIQREQSSGFNLGYDGEHLWADEGRHENGEHANRDNDPSGESSSEERLAPPPDHETVPGRLSFFV